ncbi:hypothetical protein [Paraburkholderia elongata]|uniref:Uncharacterized protein n=1 Tax=Paraburkholderia elongata TaxID=2675747 RepID=A0A972NY68_9BURK|nr:hypothetical protein [Paraburkholderia elongata]NPT59735.1 hypothetical protein [Paraburkholderia elongata]
MKRNANPSGFTERIASASGSDVERVETRALAEREKHLALKCMDVRSAPLSWL